MAKYIIKRLFISLLTIFVLVTATFFLMKLIPGNPFMNDKVPEEIQRQQLAYYGLDKPVIEQYFIYMGNLLRGDFGTSLKYVGRRVTDVIADLFPVSAKIGLVPSIIQLTQVPETLVGLSESNATEGFSTS